MASKFMKIKKIVIPFITLVIMTSQLAGCATMSSQEMLDSMQESPDVSIEWSVPDTGQQSLDASHAITVGDQQFTTDTDPEIGLIANQSNQELEEISHSELLEVFKKEYEISKEIYNSDSEETIQNELELIRITVECMDKSLPSDYETQYRDWRPSVIQQDSQDNQNTTTSTDTQQSQQSKPAQGSKPQNNKPSGSGQSQQPQGSSSEDRGTTGDDSFREIITDKSQIATGYTGDPYSDPTEVSYGGN